GAAARGEFETLGDSVSCSYGAAGALHEHGEHQANGALAHDEDEIIWMRIALDDGLETSVQRLHESGAIERYAIRDFLDAAVHDPIHYANKLRKAAASWFESSGDADLLILRTLRINFAAAIKTFTARNVVEGYDSIARPKSRYAFADSRDNTGCLMS